MVFYNQSFVCDHFTPRYNYLTCMENHIRMLVRLSGKNQSVTVLFPSQLVGDPPADDKCDERNWHREPTSADPSKKLCNSGEEPSNGPSSGGESENHTQDQEIWTETLFGYYVPLAKSEDSHNYFLEDRESETGHCSVGKKMRLVLHSWAISYPRELWKRIVCWE